MPSKLVLPADAWICGVWRLGGVGGAAGPRAEKVLVDYLPNTNPTQIICSKLSVVKEGKLWSKNDLAFLRSF
mgnify:CR=1 FL=1